MSGDDPRGFPGHERRHARSAGGRCALMYCLCFAAASGLAGGKLDNYLTPLECPFCAEVSHAASGLPLEKVNEIAKALLPKYNDSIKDPNIGKIVHDVYGLETSKPKPEWQEVYNKVR